MRKKITILLAGEAGQGVQSVESMLVSVFKKNGFNIFATKEYMSRIRGGVNSTTIIVSDKKINSQYKEIDIFIPFSNDAYLRFKDKLNSNTIIFSDGLNINHSKAVDVPFRKIATELGNAIFSNSVAAGLISGLLGVDVNLIEKDITEKFASKGDEIISKNIRAVKQGYDIGENYRKTKGFNVVIESEPYIKEELLLNGADAISFGALAGGCTACFAYPMTPSTSVFTNMASFSKKYDIAVEQVEDEIGVINMALGCWYAGGRALVTTSGGGFALMSEGLSLSGITETPVVIHLAQRPGPATGLPTRTEQGDLNLALYAGHGVFPRIILSPGDLKMAFELSRLAFDLADKFQIPVFIMSDQYFVDSYYNITEFQYEDSFVKHHFVQTDKDYKRYSLSETGVSPRGIPGYGQGLVCVDSDEHDQDGRITEDLDGISLKMKDKRLKKFETVQKASLEPVLYGAKDYKNLIIGWGSTHNIILEAIYLMNRDDTAFLFFPQVYPLPSSTESYLKKAKRIITIENNSTGQFADLIKLTTGIAVNEKILKYNGLQFYVEEIIERLKEMV